MKDTAYKIVEQLDKATLRDFYRNMVRIRVFEERCAEQYMLGNIRGFLHLYIGEEAIAAGTIPARSSPVWRYVCSSVNNFILK